MRLDTLEESVTTRYYGPTDYRGSFFVARFRGHRMTVDYDYSVSNMARHAAQLILDRYAPGYSPLYVGETRTGNRYAAIAAGEGKAS